MNNPILQKLLELEASQAERRDAKADYYADAADIRGSEPEIDYKAGFDSLVPDVIMLYEALEKCCKPEPDGLGGFVADEFTEQEVLDGRKTLAAIKRKYGVE